MKNFEYSNLNIVEINEFIRKDTKQYKDLKSSLCGKAFELETKIIEQDKATVQLVEDQIRYEDDNFDKMVYELENPNLDDLSFFAKLSLKRKNALALKKLEKEHRDTIMVLQNRLKKHKSDYEDHRVMLQHIIDKIKDKGFLWQDVRKLLEEKIGRGVFNNKVKPDKKQEEEGEIIPVKPKKPKRKTVSSGFSDASFYGDPNYYDLSNLTPEQRREFEKLLRNYNYNKEKLRQREIETARMMRMALFEKNSSNYQNLMFGLSDYALFKGLFRGLHERPDNYDSAMRKMMINSGYGLSFIDKNLYSFSSEFRRLFESGDGNGLLGRINCMCGARYFGEFGLGPGAFRDPRFRNRNMIDSFYRNLKHGFRDSMGICRRPHCPHSQYNMAVMNKFKYPCDAYFTHKPRDLQASEGMFDHFKTGENSFDFNKKSVYQSTMQSHIDHQVEKAEKEVQLEEQLQQELMFERSGPEFNTNKK